MNIFIFYGMKNKQTIAEASTLLLSQLSAKSAKELQELVRYHNDAYFEKNKPQISDEAFDKLVETLRFVSNGASALSHLGQELSGEDYRATAIHREPMLSLDKCYDNDTYYKWRNKINGYIIAMPKIDGVACSLQYDKHGQLKLAATRGDGKKGENVTDNVLRISEVPSILPQKISVEVRGEVYMKISCFKEKFSSNFANPRNLTAGALKQKDSNTSANYGLSFFPYDIRGVKLDTEEEKFKLLQKLGFVIPDVKSIDGRRDIYNIFQYYWEMRKKYDYETDGVVFRASDSLEQTRLGETSHHPKFALAYKYQGESAQTKLINIAWSVGRTGVITPICVVEPIFVSGATVTRASLHNIGIFKKLGLKKNSLIEVIRRGGVIPYVERVLQSHGKKMDIVEDCPSCGQKTLVIDDFLYCSQPYLCPAIIKERILHFCKVIDIHGFGKKLIDTLVCTGFVVRPADIYKLTATDLLPLERMGKTLVNKLLKEVSRKKELSLAVFITAFGFEEIGPNIAEALANHFGSFTRIKQANKEEIQGIHGIGDSIADSLRQGLIEYGDDINELLEQVKLFHEQEVQVFNEEHVLFGKSVIFTGKMTYLDRKTAQKYVQKLGGKTPASVSINTDYLVIGDDGSSLFGSAQKSTRQKAADKLILAGTRIKIISESNFIKIIENKI